MTLSSNWKVQQPFIHFINKKFGMTKLSLIEARYQKVGLLTSAKKALEAKFRLQSGREHFTWFGL